MLQIVSDKEIRHAAESAGVRVTREQIIFDTVRKVKTVVQFWTDWQTGRLVHVSGQEVTA